MRLAQACASRRLSRCPLASLFNKLEAVLVGWAMPTLLITLINNALYYEYNTKLCPTKSILGAIHPRPVPRSDKGLVRMYSAPNPIC